MAYNITLRSGTHRNKPIIKLIFDYHEKLVELIRPLPGLKWSSSMKCWYLPYTENFDLYLHELDGINVVDETDNKPTPDNIDFVMAQEQKKLQIIRHTRERIKLNFRFDAELIALIKTIPLYYYDANAKFWTLPHIENVLEMLTAFCKSRDWGLEYKDEWAEKKAILRKKDGGYYEVECPAPFLEKLIALRYSENTLRNYCSFLKEFIFYFKDRSIDTLEQTDIEKFILYLIVDRKVSVSYQNVSINAIKFYYEKVLEREHITVKIDRPKIQKQLPQVLSEEEVITLIGSIDNLKHKCIIMMIYSAGLRLSEVVNLKASDIDSKRMLVFIRSAKGRKDRYTILSKQLLRWLRIYYKQERPKNWLFEGVLGGQYSMKSVQEVMKEAVENAGIKKHATVHTLRHSFATHMLENGTDLRYIQNLLGHNSTKTTEVYTHITTKGLKQLVSPFDRLNLEMNMDLPEDE